MKNNLFNRLICATPHTRSDTDTNTNKRLEEWKQIQTHILCLENQLHQQQNIDSTIVTQCYISLDELFVKQGWMD